MGIHDKVKQLSGYQEESAATKGEGGEQAPPVRERKAVEPINSPELEKLLFKLSGLIEKAEVEHQEVKKLSQEVDAQRNTVGTMLVNLDGVIKSLPKTVDASVKASLSEISVNLDSSLKTICGEVSRYVTLLVKQVSSQFDKSFGNAVATIDSAADKAAATVTAMEEEKNSMALWTIAVSVLVSLLVVFITLGVANRRLPWHLSRPTSQERTYIEQGKALSKSWSQLPPKVQAEISRAVNENE
ncbi:hypothetical protein KIP69_03515 [Geobacter sulfurreducens]|uniref:hypothetical protein n=1 Tax=Geobacter sulfurreducens TaxID=35554 RepID=UPI001BDD3476|nr:hypothetical protein [Geobacter sulfurreducens]QVW35931.1 hypothetical protein KIP69_03515 [Geobacter sulfurreducens]